MEPPTTSARLFKSNFSVTNLCCARTSSPMRTSGKFPIPAGAGVFVRRGGKPTANLIDDDDEILVGIERTALTDIYLLDDLVCAGIPGGDEDGVGFPGIELAEGCVGEVARTYRTAFLQLEIADVIKLVRAVNGLRVVAVVDHCRLPIPFVGRQG